MKNIVYILLTIMFLIISCKKNNETNNKTIKGKKHLTLNKIDLDTIKVDASNTSCMGTFFMENGNIIFADIAFSSLYYYNLEGKYIKRFLGKGRGPKEIPSTIRNISPVENTDYFFAFTNGNILYRINKNSKEINNLGQIDFKWESYNKKRPNPESVFNYRINAIFPPVFKFSKINDSIYMFPTYSIKKQFSGYSRKTNADLYYKEARTFGFLNINSMKVTEVNGRYPGIYQKYKYVPNFAFQSFEMKNDSLFVNYAVDSLIHVYLPPYRHPKDLIYSFGFSGINMNQKYYETKSQKEAQKRMIKDSKKFGSYHTLKYIPKTNLLFRCYHKGKHVDVDGLQVYKNYNLIGDFKVPKNFQVIGYQNSYYYAVKWRPNMYEQTFVFYKFQIKY